MTARGVRGATTAEANETHTILAATSELLQCLCAANDISADDIASVLFTSTPDLDAAFPAEAARSLGWRDVPLIGAIEVAVPGALALCIRVMMIINTEKAQAEIVHVYLGGARALRPDLAGRD